MTNFFLEELRKIYGDGRVIHDPQFVGECCYGSLGDLRVKARFTKDIVANQYPYLTVSILNPTKGEIDSVRMKIGDIISRSCRSTIESAGRSPGNRGPSSFFSRRAHLLTTCKTGGGMPAASCALRGGCRFLRKATDNATAFADAAVIVCAIGQIPSLQPTLFSNRLRKPATGSFAAEMDRRSARPFSLLQKRNRKKNTR